MNYNYNSGKFNIGDKVIIKSNRKTGIVSTITSYFSPNYKKSRCVYVVKGKGLESCYYYSYQLNKGKNNK